MLCGKPALLRKVSVSPALMVTEAGSKTSAPESAPRLTVASAWAARVSASPATPAAAPLRRLLFILFFWRWKEEGGGHDLRGEMRWHSGEKEERKRESGRERERRREKREEGRRERKEEERGSKETGW